MKNPRDPLIMRGMKLGICTSVSNSAAIKAAGWEFVEESVQGLLQGQLPDAEWKGAERARQSALPVYAANVMVPGSIKITGPDADMNKLRDYMTRVLSRAKQVGLKRIVFGSGGARNVPDGFDRNKARQQIIDFAKMIAPLAQQNDVIIVAEHLRREECNIINTVAEAMEYVRAVNHPNFQCLVDSYHLWSEDEPLANVQAAMPWIRHVHLADQDGRVAPGESGTADYRPFFRVLKEAKYDGGISVEATGFNDFATVAPRVLAFVKKQWHEA
jgi:sugar phosphate isomerase/epimerase